MSIANQIKLLQRMNSMIRMKATGSPEEFAQRVGVSKATLYRHVDTLKELGADIHYNPHRGSFEHLSDAPKIIDPSLNF